MPDSFKRKWGLSGAVVIALVVCVGLAVGAIGCGGSDDSTASTVDPKVVMQGALDVVEAEVTGLMGSVTSGQATGADLKQALADAAPHWQAVVDACAGVKGADAAEAQQLWDALETAVEGLSDDAGLAEMAALAGPGLALQSYVTQLRELVGPSASGAPGAAVATTEEVTTTTEAAATGPEALVGKWLDRETGETMEFGAGGSFVATNAPALTYTADDDSIVISRGGTVVQTMTYSIEGDVLTTSDAQGTIVYDRVK